MIKEGRISVPEKWRRERCRMKTCSAPIFVFRWKPETGKAPGKQRKTRSFPQKRAQINRPWGDPSAKCLCLLKIEAGVRTVRWKISNNTHPVSVLNDTHPFPSKCSVDALCRVRESVRFASERSRVRIPPGPPG